MRYLEHCQMNVISCQARPDSPDYGGQEELVVVLQRSKHGLPQQEVGQDAAREDDQHGGDPEGEGMFPGED